MRRITLIRLAFVGSDVAPTSVDFGTGLNVIYGASDTGKSFIVDAIDFMLGASRLRSIPEAEPYSDVMLSFRVEDDAFTFVRSKTGGSCRLYSGVLDSVPDEPPVRRLTAKHSAKNENSISAFLLSLLGLSGRLLRKNAENALVSLSFRHVAHFAIVDETQMVSTTAPFLQGQVINKTAELSAFRILLDGGDDSHLVADQSSDEERKISRGKYEVLQQVMSPLYQSIEGSAAPSELNDQIVRLNTSIADHASLVNDAVVARDSILALREQIVERGRGQRRALLRCDELIARFGLLMEQYDSDLARLGAVQETGSLLAFFQPGVCVFCGAAVEHQVNADHTVREAADFASSVIAEQEKVEGLRRDLFGTIEDLLNQRDLYRGGLRELRVALDARSRELAELDEKIRPREAALAELMSKKAEVERILAVYAQIAQIEELAMGFEGVPTKPRSTPANWPSPESLRGLSSLMGEMLRSWEVSGGSQVAIGTAVEDVVMGGQPRADRGKGMRSILHAAFNASFAQLALNRDTEHPGFLLLDSPLVTFREPDAVQDDGKLGEEVMSHGVHAAFYRYMDAEFVGQAIIVENTTPPPELSTDATVIRFTKNENSGRYGLFPRVKRQR